ncbi:MAG: hypothetical protein QG608_861 [Actinomycetota bacterium]|nr:hypothetical protein [Actinomycetota bacterium]
MRIRWEVPPARRTGFVVVLGVVVLSMLVTVLIDFRLGGYLLAVALALAAFLRATLPAKYCLGMLVRSRQIDVITSAGLAVALAVTATVVPG